MKKMKLFLVLGLLMTALTAKSANEVYFALNETTGEATYYYDGNRASRTGLTTQVFTPGTAPFTGVKDKVKKIVIDASMQKHNLTSLSYMFSAGASSELAQLASITGLENLSTANVTNMSGMFFGCKALTSLDLSSFNTEKVTNMTHMFHFCTKVTSIKGLKNFNTANVTDMTYMFASCRAVTYLELNFNTEKVTDMSYMFSGCYALKSITGLDKFNTKKVTNMKQMFAFSGSLTYLDLSMFYFSKVENASEMFKNDSSITVIYCTDDLSASATLTTSSDMFYYCKSLIGGEGTAYNSSYKDKTYACLDQGTSKKGYFTKPVYASFDKSRGQLNYCYDAIRKMNANPTYLYDPSNGSYPLLNIADDVSLITKIVIEESMKDAKLKSTYMMFGIIFATNNISAIEGLTNLNTANVSDMSMMFDGCKVTSLDLSSFNTAKVTTMQSLFGDCVNLTTIIGLEKFNTAKVTNMSSMFFGCKALTSLDLNSFNINKVTNMDYMFKNCTNMETIYCNKDWSNSTASSDQLFRGCTKLKGSKGTEYDAEKTITYARPDCGTSRKGYFTAEKEIYASLKDGKMTLYYDDLKTDREGTGNAWIPESGMFWTITEEERNSIQTVAFDESMKEARPTSTYCWFLAVSNLTTLEHLEYLNTSEVTNFTAMFASCTSLSSIDLNSFNIEKATKLDQMFSGCTNLETIKCDNYWSKSTIITISSNMFKDCTKLKGGQGTVIDEEKVDITYARPDGGTSAPGYFTHSDPTAIENVNIETVRSEKFIENGQLYIMHNGTKYNVQGATVK